MSNVRLAALAVAVPCVLALSHLAGRCCGARITGNQGPVRAYSMIVEHEGCEYVSPDPAYGSGIVHSETCPNPIHEKVEL